MSAFDPKQTPLVALHMSAIGTKRTSVFALRMSAFRGKADRTTIGRKVALA
jgi:hypothetical protein